VTYLKLVPPGSGLLRVLQANQDFAGSLLDLHEVVMRGPSPFTPGEREFIAAYVSGLNNCEYCHGVHAATAAAFGVPTDVLSAAIADLDSAPVDGRMKPILRYVRKLTSEPARVTESDAADVFGAGWDDRALRDAVLVCGLFNLMNRVVDGLGVSAPADYLELSGVRLHDVGYAGLGSVPAETSSA
jgi:uncharacterized peroxidase-related enzyme